MIDDKEIKELFIKLLNFINQYGEGKLNIQKRIIERIVFLLSCENVDESVILEGKSLITKWKPPYEHIEITEEDRNRIYLNVKEYLLKSYPQENILEIY